MPTFLQKAATSAGNFLNSGAKPGAQSLFGNSVIDVSKTLQDYGSSGKFQIARPIYADSGGTAQQPFIGPQPLVGPIPNPKIINNNPDKTGGNVGTNLPTNNVDQNAGANDQINQNVQAGNDSIERDYQDALNQASISEGSINAQGTNAQNEINTQAQATRNAVGNELTTAQAGVADQQSTANKTAASGMQGARDLFRQTQQQNIAQLSALGLSSSSVMEGLAEKLGVETARRIGGLTGSLEEVTQNLVKEGARVKDYAAQKLTEVESTVGNQIQSIRSQMIDSLNQINQNRQVAATAKASARADLMTQARTQIYQLQASAQTFAQQMQTWAAQKSSTLSNVNKEFTISQEGLGAAYTTALNSSGMPNISGFQNIPQVEQGSNGMYKIVNGKYVKVDQEISTAGLPKWATAPTQ